MSRVSCRSECYTSSYSRRLRLQASTCYGAELYGKPEIRARINELKQERIDQLGIDANYVLMRLVEIDRLDVADILEDDLSIKPLSAWPESWRRYLSGFNLAEMFEGRGDDREMVGILKRLSGLIRLKTLSCSGVMFLFRRLKTMSKMK